MPAALVGLGDGSVDDPAFCVWAAKCALLACASAKAAGRLECNGAAAHRTHPLLLLLMHGRASRRKGNMGALLVSGLQRKRKMS